MERIKKIRHILLPILVAVFLFLIPFFWLKPGEMDLGGDSSRLYFYDPLNYLINNLYGVSASSFGLETIYYFNIPFVFLLLALKAILGSPTLVISVFHGFSLSAGFAFVYLIIKELIEEKKGKTEINLRQYAAMLGGIFYALSPALVDGWEHVLVTRNQVFLNPLIFYLLFRYFKTNNLKYIFTTILLTFVFSPSFSVISSPPIFAFYPISILFLILYTKLILRKKIIVKHLIFGLTLFIGVQAFHLIPQIKNIFIPVSSGNDINSTIFSNSFKYDRGLSFFSAIAPSIKLSINLLGFPQNRQYGFLSSIFFLFTSIAIFSLLIKKNKTIILTTFFFLIVLFFVTASITHAWLWFYEKLFYIPGFSMFRNFYGQWQFAYVFFYSILFGQALYVMLGKLNKKNIYLLLTVLTLFLVINAKPFIVGDAVRKSLWQSNDVVEIMKMDPDYEQILTFIRSLPSDAKVWTLPMTDPSYQIVSGINGGAYMGPSTIAYLAGKKDFAGFEEFQDYKSLILKLVNNQQYGELTRLLGFLNVKYIFYNADPNVYDKFPGFPYQQVRKFMPKDQKFYKQFVDSLGYKLIKNINNKYFVFELQDDNYVPQIYIAKKTEHYNKPSGEVDVPLSLSAEESRIAIDNSRENIAKNYPIKFDETLTDIGDKNSFLDFFVNADYSVGFSYAFSAWPINSPIYPFIVLRENYKLSKIKLSDTYIETALLISDKRVQELERWGEIIPVLGGIKNIDAFDRAWHEPTVWKALINRNAYNSWEIGLLRYKRQIYDLIDGIEEGSNNSLYSVAANKEKVKKAVIADRERLYSIIESEKKLSSKQKIYLLKLCIGIFDPMVSRLQPKIPSPGEVSYDLSNLEKGEYTVYIDKKSLEKVDQSVGQVVINDRKLYLKDFQQDSAWYRGQNVSVKDGTNNVLSFLSMQSVNLLSDKQWKLSEVNNFENNTASLSIESADLPNNNGLIQQIDDWSSNSYYLLSFEYLTYGKSFKISTFDRSLQNDSSFKKIFEDDLRSTEWRPYRVIFKSSNNANLASVQILKSERGLLDTIDSKDLNSKIEMRNVSIIEVPNPKIILKRIITPSSQGETLPKITFTKFNPTKYQIDVKNMMRPYTLVFAEAFNSEWRLVDLDPKTNTASFRGDLSRLFAGIGNAIGSVLRIGKAKESGTISYFDGDVKENYSEDVFLDGKTFNAWGKNEIAPDRHFTVNGYFNAWYIKPEDLGGKTEYTLILELTTQKLFYKSLIISAFVVILCITLLTIKLFKRSSDEK